MSTTERAPEGTLVARPPLRSLVEELQERRRLAKLGGGPGRIECQHAEGKLTARERIALLLDEGSFTELGIHGRPHFSQRAMEGREAPADGVVPGFGRVDAGNAMIDDVIDPRETLPTVIRALEMAEGKRVERPRKQHGVMPV